MKTYLLVSVFFHEQRFLADIAKSIHDSRCNIEKSYSALHHNMWSATFCLSGSWDAIAKVEVVLDNLGQKSDVKLLCHRPEAQAIPTDTIPYSIEVNTHDKPGVMDALLRFFYDKQITVYSLTSKLYNAPITQVVMGQITLIVLVPLVLDLPQLREHFLVFCDSLNVDAMIVPERE